MAMFVNTALLHSGANDSHRAGWHADDGANQLVRTSPVTGIFGDFEAAHAFHEAVARSHTHHTAMLRAHQETLCNVGDKARTAAVELTDMEERNAAELRAVRCSSVT
jgi:hypothetical protein